MRDGEGYEWFNAVSGLSGRSVVLFGAGRMAAHYLERYGEMYPPILIVDNDTGKWGSHVRGTEVKSPDALAGLTPGSFRVVIATGEYEAVAQQLAEMGLGERECRVYNRGMDSLLAGRLDETVSEGKYNIGYVTGVFDLFHVGHLNLLRNCKRRCHYLVAGVLTDELAERDKGKRPFIPFVERLEIVRQCRYVDRVIRVDFHNTSKVEAWKALRYGCLFSGSDHEGEGYWMWLQRQLRTLGSDLEFFPYTQSTSSSMLQAVIRDAR